MAVAQQMPPRPRVTHRYGSREEALRAAGLQVIADWHGRDPHMSEAEFTKACHRAAANHHGLRWRVSSADVARSLESQGLVERYGPTVTLAE